MDRKVLYKVWLLIIPASAFFLRDVIATMILLSTEPGITPKAAFYFSVALLPGTLVVDAERALFLNVLLGALLGGILFLLSFRQKNSSQI